MITLPNSLKSSSSAVATVTIVTRKCSLWIARASNFIFNFWFLKNMFLIWQRIREKRKKCKKSTAKYRKKYVKSTKSKQKVIEKCNKVGEKYNVVKKKYKESTKKYVSPTWVPEAWSKTLRTPQKVPAWTVFWPYDPV